MMSWPIDEDGAPITCVYGGVVLKVRAEWCPYNGGSFGYGDLVMTKENLGVVWARGWDTQDAEALEVAHALRPRDAELPPGWTSSTYSMKIVL